MPLSAQSAVSALFEWANERGFSTGAPPNHAPLLLPSDPSAPQKLCPVGGKCDSQCVCPNDTPVCNNSKCKVS